METPILDVSQVNEYLKNILENDPLLNHLCIRGELSNYKIYPSGHHYFTLKDCASSIRCVMFKSNALRLRFRPEDGMKVLVTGKISVYPRDGTYQLYCASIMPDGIGDLHVAFEQLKARLQEEGLFEHAHKKTLPAYPHRIAVVTSPAGAAVHDMLRILGKRYPLSKVLLLPVRVQGTEAPEEIAGAIRYVNQWKLADVIITGRGGGSIEDLWAFNDERVARAIYESDIAVVSAVGHEPDVTISDYVADVRAATPSNAAELVAPDQSELRESLRAAQSAMSAAAGKLMHIQRQRLAGLRNSRSLQSPVNYINDRRLTLDYAQKRLISASKQQLLQKRQRYVRLTAMLDAMSPLKVLSRGYGMVRDQNGSVVKSCSSLEAGESIEVVLGDGSLSAQITEIREEIR
jgi:exodeoxyribonuclease VII large subunit